ncbi:hypothetical protein [Jannaschia sp. R86511]|uniref:hypothetical protein n=1 Tax=Jannaschia sp. R86511 TaxID=3093853 RepID=UPI0036D2D187
MVGATGARGRRGAPVRRGLAVGLVVGLGLLGSGCGALDRALVDDGDEALVDDGDEALVDDGDEALVADASVRAAGPTVDPAESTVRPVRFVFAEESGRAPVATSSDAGRCGWEGEVWQAGLGNGGVTLGSDDLGRTWSRLAVTASAGADPVEPGADGSRELDAVLDAGWERYPDDDGLVEQGGVRQAGRLQVDESGLSARFVPDGPGTMTTQGGAASGGTAASTEPALPGDVLTVTCGAPRDPDAG